MTITSIRDFKVGDKVITKSGPTPNHVATVSNAIPFHCNVVVKIKLKMTIKDNRHLKYYYHCNIIRNWKGVKHWRIYDGRT